jgi:hypothetical protein
MKPFGEAGVDQLKDALEFWTDVCVIFKTAVACHGDVVML